ncbi:BTB/POZ domain-containing protein [Bimuria novae-zelandiae CBS 107.79]|uniref:BTB/POZ domain-containing protein n=1 Tax=Bimuria novae-zelandiae CBS 107.79 TaxID=1447943 RepID=A0A6A5UQA4_9PLEO|nr:BTB/POZ domain-containing protein [Bimuria novae-zelandiae CBS 107.79]
MFNKQEYSDITVKIHGTKLYAHRFVICVQSRYFAKAFQDKTFKEGNTGEISFDQDSPLAHWGVFEYLYTGDYSDNLNVEGLQDDPALLKDPRVYYLAEKFFLEGLKELALSKLKDRLKKGWQSKIFPVCVEEIYAITSSSSSMRVAVAKIAAEHGKDLQEEETFLDLLHGGGEFVVDFYKALRIW